MIQSLKLLEISKFLISHPYNLFFTFTDFIWHQSAICVSMIGARNRHFECGKIILSEHEDFQDIKGYENF